MSDLVQVPFHGDTLWALERDGRVFVAVKPMCEALGVDWPSQVKRLKRDAVLSQGVVMTTIPSAGGQQQTICLPLEYLNGWLFGIDDRRIASPEARAKVLAYKRECYDVLFRYFFAKAAAALVGDGDAAPDRLADFDRSELRTLIALVAECRSVWGRPAAQRLWRRLPLPQPDDDAPPGSVSAFLAAVVVRASGAKVQASALYRAYERWCRQGGIAPVSQTSFGRELSQLGVAKQRNGAVWYHDVACRSEADITA